MFYEAEIGLLENLLKQLFFSLVIISSYPARPRRITVKYQLQEAISQYLKKLALTIVGSWGGAAVRAHAYHQCVPGSIPGPGVICGLSLLVLALAPRVFLRFLQFFSLLKNQHF